MPNRPMKYTFIGKDEPDTIIGERIVVKVPLDRPPLGEFNNISLGDLIRHAEKQFISILQQHGNDCAHFEITLGPEGSLGVIYTRPMDRVEAAQIRAYRQRQHEGKPRLRPAMVESAIDTMPQAHRIEDRMPDPSVLPRTCALDQSLTH